MPNHNVLFNKPLPELTKTSQVTFMWTEDDKEEVLYPNAYALVIKANVASKEHNKILVELGSLVDIFLSQFRSDGNNGFEVKAHQYLIKRVWRRKLMLIGVMDLPITVRMKPFGNKMMLTLYIYRKIVLTRPTR